VTTTDPLLPGPPKPIKPVFVPTFNVEPFDDGALPMPFDDGAFPMPFDDGGIPIINDDPMIGIDGLPIDLENPDSSPLTDKRLPPSEENEVEPQPANMIGGPPSL